MPSGAPVLALVEVDDAPHNGLNVFNVLPMADYCLPRLHNGEMSHVMFGYLFNTSYLILVNSLYNAVAYLCYVCSNYMSGCCTPRNTSILDFRSAFMSDW